MAFPEEKPRASPKGDYDVVTTDLSQVNPESCTVCPNGDYLQIAVLFLGGGIQAALLRESPFSAYVQFK
jgi:hypothetical protein